MARCNMTNAVCDHCQGTGTHRALWSTREGGRDGEVGRKFLEVVTQELRAF